MGMFRAGSTACFPSHTWLLAAAGGHWQVEESRSQPKLTLAELKQKIQSEAESTFNLAIGGSSSSSNAHAATTSDAETLPMGAEIRQSAHKHIISTVQEEESWLCNYQDLGCKGFRSISQGEQPSYGVFVWPSSTRSSISSRCTTTQPGTTVILVRDPAHCCAAVLLHAGSRGCFEGML